MDTDDMTHVRCGDLRQCEGCEYLREGGRCAMEHVPVTEIDFEGRCDHYCVPEDDEILEGAEWVE